MNQCNVKRMNGTLVAALLHPRKRLVPIRLPSQRRIGKRFAP
jgi:hypothetical protein